MVRRIYSAKSKKILRTINMEDKINIEHFLLKTHLNDNSKILEDLVYQDEKRSIYKAKISKDASGRREYFQNIGCSLHACNTFWDIQRGKDVYLDDYSSTHGQNFYTNQRNDYDPYKCFSRQYFKTEYCLIEL